MAGIGDVEKLIKEEIHKLRNLGEHARKGSDHLYYRSIFMFKLGKLKELNSRENYAFEIICEYDIYTETEFLHSPDMDEFYTEHYKDKFIFDKNFKLLKIKDVSRK